jgi:multidrug resistance efflux pump
MNSTSSLDRSHSENGSASLGDRVRSLRLDNQALQGAKGKTILPWSLCGILLMTTAAFGYRAYRLGPAEPVAAEEVRSTRPTAATAREEAAPGEVVLQSKGYIIPAHQVQVSPKVGGQILRLHERFKEGEFFKENEVLAELEDVDYRAEVAHARAAMLAAEQRYRELETGYRKKEIEQARFELEEAHRTTEQLRLDMRRNERLLGQNAIGQREYEQSKYAYDAMERRVRRLEMAYDLMCEGPRRERIDAARGDWEAAQSDLRKAECRLKWCKILAPISGHVLTKKAEKGNVVNPLAFNVSASLCDMANLGDLEVDLNIQERDVSAVYPGQSCTILPEAFQKYEPFRQRHPKGYTGTVSRLMPTADRAKGAIPVRVRVDIPADEVGKYLKPEMSVLVSFLSSGTPASSKHK